jgi:cysteine desulfurase
MKTKKIYLDYAATTPVDKNVLKKMLPYFSQKYGNASSLHGFGREASEAVEKAREAVANFFSADPKEIIFTSGATESNNLAIKGIIGKYFDTSKYGSILPHIITTQFEHHCVLDSCKTLEKQNLVKITYIKPDKNGLIRVEDIKNAIKPNTILVSIMYVNNEIGTVQPIAAIGKILKKCRLKIIFHTDATQAVPYFDCNVNKLNVDMISMSSHKIYGPKGVGSLYIRKGTPIIREQDGGAQEFSLRAGTINSSGIVGLGEAISQLTTRNSNSVNKRILNLRNHLIKRVLAEIPDSRLNGSKIKRTPNNANFIFSNVEGESLILMLDKAGVACSTGSACSSGTLAPSHVLISLGLKPEEAHGSIRMTLGKYTTKKEINAAVDKLKKVVADLRKISGGVLKDYYNK